MRRGRVKARLRERDLVILEVEDGVRRAEEGITEDVRVAAVGLEAEGAAVRGAAHGDDEFGEVDFDVDLVEGEGEVVVFFLLGAGEGAELGVGVEFGCDGVEDVLRDDGVCGAGVDERDAARGPHGVFVVEADGFDWYRD